MSFTGKRIVVTGGCGFLGHKIVDSLVALDAEVVVVDKVSNARSSTNQKGSKNVNFFQCDLSERKSREDLLRLFNSEFNKIHGLVNAAAIVVDPNIKGWSNDFELQTLDMWEEGLEVNLTAAFHLCQGLTALLRKSRSGTIVNIGSLYGFLGPNWSLYEGTQMGNSAAYSASKGGLHQLTRWLSTTLSPDIRVNTLTPGGIFRQQPKSFVEKFERLTPLGRMAREDDYIGPLIFLLSDMSGYMTGQNLVVDGGWSVW